MTENTTPPAQGVTRAGCGPQARSEDRFRLPSERLSAMADALSVPDGGFTVDPVTGADVRTGYAVSVHPECERVLDHPVTAMDLASYVADRAATLERPRRVLGGWHDPDTGHVYLDVSIVVATEAAARRRGRLAGQKAVFDLAAGESRLIPRPRRHGAGNRPAQAGKRGTDRPRGARPPRLERVTPVVPEPRPAESDPTRSIPTPQEWAEEQLAQAPQRSQEWARDVASIYGLEITRPEETE
ncbi:hypothetical protein [Amycolatopsis albispora]|uniref:hypothetical protein n=1 Tax=Amycolatopsis albispora TaxID=1804986 RepID=UPI0013B3D74F|nr:hypothetical protein [Amycolatopsis albispora]